MRPVFSIEWNVEIRGHSGRQTSYYIPSRDVCTEKLMELAREHWKIESMHWLLNVTFSEDNSRLFCENAVQIMNALLKFALVVHKNFLAANHLRFSIKALIQEIRYCCDFIGLLIGYHFPQYKQIFRNKCTDHMIRFVAFVFASTNCFSIHGNNWPLCPVVSQSIIQAF